MTPEPLESWRERLELTQAIAASLVGVSRSAWIKYEKSERAPVVVRRAMDDVERELAR